MTRHAFGFLTSALCIAGLVLITEAASAQVFQPVGKQLGDVSSALVDIQGKSAVYAPVDPDKEFKLFYIPFFALEEAEPGSRRPKVQVEKSPNVGNGLVTITLLLSPQNKVDALARYVRANAELNALDDRYKDIQPVNLTGIPLSNLRVDEVEPRYGFRQVNLPSYSAQGTLRLVAEMRMEMAEQVASEIERGQRVPEFDISYDLAADQELSESTIRANAVYLYHTDAAKDLMSSKPAGETFGFHVGPDGVQLSQPFLTRNQRQTFEGKIRTEVSMVLRIGNEKDNEFVRQMMDYFDKVFERADPLSVDGPLSQQLANLSSYELDDEDLKADKLNKLVADVKNFFSQEDWQKNTFEADASASFLGIGASGSVKTSGESLHKEMIDKGWKFEVQGGITVPKAFEVHIINQTSLKSEGAVSGAVIRQQRGFTGFVHRVSASNLYHLTTAGDKSVDIAELRAQVLELKRGTFLGDIELLSPNQEYEAETDGFVIAFTSGPTPDRGITFYLNGTAISHFDGGHRDAGEVRKATVTLPVPRGAAWRVETFDENGKPGGPATGTTVRWLPLAR